LFIKKYPRGQRAVHPTNAAEDNFLLYTPGPSCVDHGGEMTKMWAEDGDTIFWPLAEGKSKSKK